MSENLLAIALEPDMLEILVKFTKKTEYVDNDLASVFEYTEDVAPDLKNLQKSKGRITRVFSKNWLQESE